MWLPCFFSCRPIVCVNVCENVCECVCQASIAILDTNVSVAAMCVEGRPCFVPVYRHLVFTLARSCQQFVAVLLLP